MLKKLNTWLWYFYEYIRFGDFLSVYAAIKYVILKKSHHKDRIIQTSVGIFYCRKNTNDFQFANFRYEWGVKKFLLDHIHEYAVFIDGGSGIGDYAVLVSKYNIRSIAFEPMESNFEVLEKNIQLNNLTGKVKAVKVGLGNENKMVRFKYNQVNTGASHIDKGNNPDSFEVELRTFDSFLQELNLDKDEPILFKLDLEGMESEALQGCPFFISQYSNITFIIEDKLTGRDKIISVMDKLGSFEYGTVDQYNMYARKN
jgi:FkbM family methyltransferase